MLTHLFTLLYTLLALFVADEQPVFRNGQKDLVNFIYTNMIYPEYSKQNCLQGTINVSFRLNHRGRIYDSSVQKGFGTDLDDEALRIVRLTSGKWTVPASHDTLTAMVLPVNFVLRDSRCVHRSKDEMNAAVNAYQARMGMSDVIFNFYDKKASGNFSAAEEARIADLKLQLGYDDKFIDRLLRQAERKLKQGDREGACEDLITIRRLGSDRSVDLISKNCR